jgi:DNA-binding winged helix-turn-helix (wHTH) protein/predicted ATPase
MPAARVPVTCDASGGLACSGQGSLRASVDEAEAAYGVAAPGGPIVNHAAISFGPFRLDLRGGQLLRGSRPIPLRPKTWRVLHYLAERPGVLVTKNELLDAVWPDVAVTEWVLSKSIRELRIALHDTPKAARLIETVQRRGFRFIAPITAAQRAGRSEVPSSSYLGQESAPRVPFVGRAEELRRLSSAFAHALRGERANVFVSGEAGIGKTALVGTFLDSPAVSVAGVPVWIARGTCVGQHGAREAYMPVLEALEGLARRPDASRFTAVLRRVAPTWLAQMPGLINDEDQHALRRTLQGIKPERMLREFAAFVEAVTAEVAIVLVLEDLHWSDASTVDLLWTLGQRREPARLLVIGTFRPAEAIAQEHSLMKVMRTLALHRQCIELPLSYLSEADVLRYLEERFPGNDFPAALARLIRGHTDGNPLFMTGVTDHLLQQGSILDTAPGWKLRAPPETITLGIPDDVRLLIDNDLEGLSPADRGLLQAASVAGEDFSPVVVAATLGCEVADVEMRCEALVRARRFLRAAGYLEWPDGSVSRRYGFVHELYRRAVYAQITEGQCMQLHRRIGQALEIAYGARQTEIASQLATHFERGHDEPRALRYLSAAAERARLRFADREALEYLDAALVLLARLPENDERRRKELELRLALGAPLSSIHGFASEQVRENYERAAELCAAVGSAAQLLGILYARWYLHGMRAERDETIAIAAELDARARRFGSAQQRVVAASVLVRTAVYDARFTEAQRLMPRRLMRPCSAERLAAPDFGPDPMHAAAMHSALALWFLGHPERAQTSARAIVKRARTFGHFFTLSAVLTQAALVELLCRNPAAGRDLAEESMALSATHGFAFWNAVASVLGGWALVQEGHVSEGNATIAAALGAMQATGTRYFSAFTYAFLAEGHLRAGALADGLAAVDAGLAVAETSLDRAYTPELWRLKGELIQEQLKVESGKWKARSSKGEEKEPATTAQAEACFRRALTAARASQAKSLELRAAASLARAWQARGRTADARKVLGGICKWFGARVTRPDLVEARTLLGELGRAARVCRTPKSAGRGEFAMARISNPTSPGSNSKS